MSFSSHSKLWSSSDLKLQKGLITPLVQVFHMIKRFIRLTILAVSSLGLWVLNLNYEYPVLTKVFYTVLSFSVFYLLFKIVLEELASRTISGQKTSYVFRKAVSIIYLAIFSVAVVRIWVENPEALFVAYGLVSAGIAVALQDVFRNFAGGITLFVSKPYQVGDRIEIEGEYGDVIDIGLFYTKLLEIREWVNADQATGRMVNVPNGRVLKQNINNYTEDNTFVWDEISIPIKYSSDWKKARERFGRIVEEHTSELSERAGREIESIGRKYLLDSREVSSKVYIELTDNWVEFHIRFVNEVEARREHHNTLSLNILEAAEEMDDVEIASETVDITDFPER